jgi:hypothetical protein
MAGTGCVFRGKLVLWREGECEVARELLWPVLNAAVGSLQRMLLLLRSCCGALQRATLRAKLRTCEADGLLL